MQKLRQIRRKNGPAFDIRRLIASTPSILHVSTFNLKDFCDGGTLQDQIVTARKVGQCVLLI